MDIVGGLVGLSPRRSGVRPASASASTSAGARASSGPGDHPGGGDGADRPGAARAPDYGCAVRAVGVGRDPGKALGPGAGPALVPPGPPRGHPAPSSRGPPRGLLENRGVYLEAGVLAPSVELPGVEGRHDEVVLSCEVGGVRPLVLARDHPDPAPSPGQRLKALTHEGGRVLVERDWNLSLLLTCGVGEDVVRPSALERAVEEHLLHARTRLLGLRWALGHGCKGGALAGIEKALEVDSHRRGGAEVSGIGRLLLRVGRVGPLL
mmetsp:Transcript_4954/g.10414  ORF Transcript_4954/g.10414 Transcript_4954/m.10414 type:complete len:265 (+) Transcript_4954:371-1165(+)